MLKFKKEEYREYHSKTYRLPMDLIVKIDELANKNNTSSTKIVIQCLEYALNNIEEEIKENP